MEFTDERLAVSINPASGEKQFLAPDLGNCHLFIEPIVTKLRDSTVNPGKTSCYKGLC